MYGVCLINRVEGRGALVERCGVDISGEMKGVGLREMERWKDEWGGTSVEDGVGRGIEANMKLVS